MAKRAAAKKMGRNGKAPRRRRPAARTRAKVPAFTSKSQWKRAAAKRWPPVDRTAARNQETQGTPSLGASTGEMATLRLAALRAAALMPGAAGAPAAGSRNWSQLGPMAIPNGQTQTSARVLVSGRVTAIAIDPTAPDTIYLGAAQGGVWKSVDNGGTWQPKTDKEVSLAVGALALDPNFPQIVYVGTGESNGSADSYYGLGILKSTDGAGSWKNFAADTFAKNRFYRLAVFPRSGAPATVLFAATSLGLYRSVDGGETWKPLTTGLPGGAEATNVVLHAGTNTLYVAFSGKGIYRSSNASDDLVNFTQLTAGLPDATAPAPNGVTRIALTLSPSDPQTVFALMANNDLTDYQRNGPPYRCAIDKFCVTTNGGASWDPIALPGPVTAGIGGQGTYNLAVTVDPTTPDIVYLSATSLWKAVRSDKGWDINDIGGSIYPDNHALAFRPGNHLQVWAGSDGGIYRSTDGGATWDDFANEGLCIMQLEFIDQHPSSAAVIFAGTQDNGTEQYRGTPVFTHADDGDGGYVVINQTDPTHVISTYYFASPKLSTQGGRFDTWKSVSAGVGGQASLFYPPMTACRTNAKALALGTALVNIDPAEGTGAWKTQVTLPGLWDGELISALSYVNEKLIYAGTNAGRIYKLTLAARWTPELIGAVPPLPNVSIMELSALPGNDAAVIAVMSDFKVGHVWRRVVPPRGPAAWRDISGDLPDIPVNALVIDPRNADRIFIGTDIGVFATANGGTNWSNISTGLPNCAVFDLRLHAATRLLRAATHGRGIWEIPVDASSTPVVDVYLRDHVMDTARMFPPPAGVLASFDDLLRYVALGDPQYPWMCADIKVDALEGAVPSYQMAVADVDYVAFETKLQHRQPRRAKVNRVYLQIYNRGIAPATDVTVKILWADASAAMPDLPADFWTAFPGDSADTAQWRPVGAAKTIAAVQPAIPTVMEWDWTPPAAAAEQLCLVAVMDSASDPMPTANKVSEIRTLVAAEKRVGWKNLQIVDRLSVAPSGILSFHGKAGEEQAIQIIPHGKKLPQMSLIFSKQAIPPKRQLAGLAAKAPSKALLKALTTKYGNQAIASFDTSIAFALQSPTRPGSLSAVWGGTSIRAIVAIEGAAAGGGGAAFSVVQAVGKSVVGGSTFAMKKG